MHDRNHTVRNLCQDNMFNIYEQLLYMSTIPTVLNQWTVIFFPGGTKTMVNQARYATRVNQSSKEHITGFLLFPLHWHPITEKRMQLYLRMSLIRTIKFVNFKNHYLGVHSIFVFYVIKESMHKAFLLYIKTSWNNGIKEKYLGTSHSSWNTIFYLSEWLKTNFRIRTDWHFWKKREQTCHFMENNWQYLLPTIEIELLSEN